MTAPIWSDEYGLALRLRKTTSPDYYFLEVREPKAYYKPEDVTHALRPFMELKEVGAIWHPVAKGWLLPVKDFPGLYPFLRSFYRVLPSKGQEEPNRESVLENSGIEYQKASEFENSGRMRAFVHNLSFDEVRLLALLYIALVPFRERGTMIFSDYESASQDLENLAEFIPSEGYDEEREVERDISDDLNSLIEKDSVFGELLSQYAVFRIQDTPGTQLRRGDILQPDFAETQASFMIYNGEMFEPLDESERYEGAYVVPQEFKVPTPFPFRYWHGLFGGGDQVHPNFDVLLERMEFELNATVPEALLKNHVSYTSAPLSSLRFELEGVQYYIYFHGTYEEAPTYEQVLRRIDNPDPYEAISDTILVTSIKTRS